MDEELLEFSSIEAAYEWLDNEFESHGCVDNHRFAYVDEPVAVAAYEMQQANGCCGSYDGECLIDGRRAMFGCNFGH